MGDGGGHNSNSFPQSLFTLFTTTLVVNNKMFHKYRKYNPTNIAHKSL